MRSPSPHDQVLRNQSVGRTSQPRRLRPAIVDGDPDEHVFRAFLGVLDEHVEIAVFVEDAGVEQLVLGLLPRAAAVRLDQVA